MQTGKVFFPAKRKEVALGKGKKRKKSPHTYWQRTYRQEQQSGLLESRVRLMETDLHILAPKRVEDESLVIVAELRTTLEQYITDHPDFLQSLVPLSSDGNGPAVVQEMLTAGAKAGVGPMAAVAGMFAEAVGKSLETAGNKEVIVENGGDIYVHRHNACTIAIFAGESPLSGRVGIRLQPEQMPCGVCTSSASIGHSLSLGQSDAAVVVAPSTPFADALATRLGNEVRSGRDGLQRALQVVQEMDNVTGAVLIAGKELGVWGAIELVRIAPQDQSRAKAGKG